MPNITLNQHRAGLSRGTIAIASYDKAPKSGLSAFFPSVTSPTLEVAIEVERMQQFIAVDVQRGRRANRNTFSKSTEKLYVPPFFAEKFDYTSLARYDVTFGSANPPTAADVRMMMSSAGKKVLALKNKIERAIEKQRADVFQTGIVTMINGDSIDYKRQANSMVTLAGTAKWDAPTTADPGANLELGGEFLRQEGLSGATTIDVIFGSAAFNNFKNNNKIKAEADIRRFNRIDLAMPKFDNTTDLVFHGQYASGDYTFNLWTYNAWYKDPADGLIKKFLDTNTVVMVPEDFEGHTAFGAIPLAMKVDGSEIVGLNEGDFFYHDMVDPEGATWDQFVKSAPLAVPVSVDRIYTIKTA